MQNPLFRTRHRSRENHTGRLQCRCQSGPYLSSYHLLTLQNTNSFPPPKAAALSLKTRDDNLTGIIAQVLNCPITCHPMHLPKDKYELQSPDQNGCAPVMDTPKIIWCWAQYLPGAEPDAYASPLLAKSFANLPPTREFWLVFLSYSPFFPD